MRLKIPCTIRLPLLGALTLLGLGSAHAQGDACAAAVNLTVSGNYVADGPSTGAGASNLCFGTGATDADWYKFTAFDNGNATVSSCADAGDIDSRLSIYSGTCAALVCVTQDDDGCNVSGFSSDVTFAVTAGTTYYIEWDDRWSGAGFSWDLTVPPAPPVFAAETCPLAQAILLPGIYSANGPGTGSGQEPFCFGIGGGGNADWYKWTPPNNGTAIVTSCADPGDVDSRLSIGTGTCGSLTCVASNDDFCNTSGFSSQATFAVTQGQTYYIQWDDRWSTAAFDWELQFVPIFCVSPAATATAVASCPSPTHTIDVDITSTGSGATAGLSYTVNAGAPVVLTGLATGITSIGPFNAGDDVSMTLLHESDAACDVVLGTITYECPAPGDDCGTAIDLGTLVSPYSSSTLGAGIGDDFANACAFGNTSPDLVFYIDVPNNYTLEIGQTVNGYDSENTVFYGATCPGTTQIACWDDPDIQTVAWVNTTGSTQRVWWVQDGWSGPGNAGTFTLAWNLIACAPPAASVAVVENCGAGTFTLDVNVTSFGSGTDADVTASVNGGVPSVVNAPILGIVSIGPFTSGSIVEVGLLHSSDTDCDEIIGTFTDCCNGVCTNAAPAIVGVNYCPPRDCGAGASGLGGFATNARWFSFTPPATGQISIDNCGSNIYGGLTLHDGTPGCGALGAPLGYSTFGACGNGAQLQNIPVTGGTTYLIEWDDSWFVGGPFNWNLDYISCTPPVATASVTDNCGANTFMVDVNITDLGTSTTFDIVATPGGVVGTLAGLGVTSVGPFPGGTPISITLVSSTDPGCTFTLPGSYQDCCNGICTGAVAAVLGVNTTGPINCGGSATNAIQPFGTQATNARWFSYTAPGTGYLTASSCPPTSTVDTRVSFHDGTCGTLNFLGGNDDGCGVQSTSSIFVNPGQSIFIEWDDRWSPQGFDWDLSFAPCTTPASDLCVNQVPSATPLAPGSSATFAMDVNCTSDDVGIAPQFGGGTSGYGWISFDLTACADVVIDYCGTTGPWTNVALNMYADCGGVNPVNSQTFNTSACGDGNPSIFYNSLPPGQYYYPVLSGAGWTNNVFTVNVTANTPAIGCTPNQCADAETLVCGVPVVGTTISNTATQGAICLPNFASPGADAWYVYDGLTSDLDAFPGDGVATTFTLGGPNATVHYVSLTGPQQVNAIGDGVTTAFDITPGDNAAVNGVLVNGVPQVTATPPNNLRLSITTDQYGTETSWQLENSVPAVIASAPTFTYPSNSTTLVPIGNVPDDNYTLTFFDSFGDGMCCAYGVGGYTLTDLATNTTLATGGTFGSSQVNVFSIVTLAGDYYISPGTGVGGADQVVFFNAPAAGLPVVIDFVSDATLSSPADYTISVGTGGGGEDQVVMSAAPAVGSTVNVSYGVVAPSQLLTASTCFGSGYNTWLTVYEAAPDCSNLTCITGNDDGCGTPEGASEINWISTPGTQYYIAVSGPGGFVNSTGTYTLIVTCQAPCTPQSNDLCSGATALVPVLGDGTGVPSTGDNTCSFADANPSCAIDNVFVPNAFKAQGVWYSFNSGVNTSMQLTLLDVDEDPAYTSTALSYVLYEGTCGSLTEVTCVTAGEGTTNLTGLTPNTDHSLMVYNRGGIGLEGTFGILLEFPAQNDAALTTIDAPVGNVCNTTITPMVTLQNNGQQTLTSVTITYDLDGGTPVVYAWTGSIAFGASEVVTLPSSVTTAGPHTINVSSSLPNGVADQLPGDDAISGAFAVAGEGVELVLDLDQYPSETTWEIYDAFFLVVANGGPYAFGQANTTVVETLCLSIDFGSCYSLYIYDQFGDGMCCSFGFGSWAVRSPNGGTLLSDVFHGSGLSPDGLPDPGTVNTTPSPTPASPSYLAHSFCLPGGPANIEAGECGVFTNTLQSKVYCNSVPGVSSYQFEFGDPDAGFIRRIAVSGRNWVKFGEMVTSPLQPGTYYFTRVRGDQGAPGFSDDQFGTGCETGIDPNQVPGCTQLIDDIGLPTHSCNTTKLFGAGDKIYALPILNGTQYRFRFENAGEGFVRVITRPNYICLLNWTTLPLQTGSTYSVTVEVLVNGQWSGYCGNACNLTIGAPPAQGSQAREIEVAENSGLQIWPNPVRDGQVNILLSDIAEQEQTITIDVIDLFGKRVHAKQFNNSGEQFNTVLDLDGLAAGVYVVTLTVNERIMTERITVQ